jgi:hypothetical protein
MANMSVITNPAELRCRGMEILIRELGFVNALRFLLQFETGAGNYSIERDLLIPNWTLEQMIDEADGLQSMRPDAK